MHLSPKQLPKSWWKPFEVKRNMVRQLRSEFEQQGFLVLPNFVEREACDALRQRALEIVQEFDPAHASVFSTTMSLIRTMVALY